MQVQKTNAARLLDAAGIPYSLVPYEVDEEHLEASHVAEQLGDDLDRVFKTLVLRGDKNGLFVCVVPGSTEVDLKVAARISGNKNCAMIHVKELLPLTGYIRGGCSPIGMKKPFPTFIHESALLWDTISADLPGAASAHRLRRCRPLPPLTPALNSVLPRIVAKSRTEPALKPVLSHIVAKSRHLPALNSVLVHIVAKIRTEEGGEG